MLFASALAFVMAVMTCALSSETAGAQTLATAMAGAVPLSRMGESR